MTDSGVTIEHIEPSNILVVADPRSTAIARLAPDIDWARLEKEAELIATAPGLVGELAEPKAARFVAYMAQRFGMDPVMFATKVYFTESKDKKGNVVQRVGFEAQLIHAMIEGDPGLEGPLTLIYGYSDPTKQTALYRFLRVEGKLKGADRPSVLTTPTVAQIGVKNSPLWFSDPDQQLAYYGVRAWARRYRPSRILGIYSREEIELRVAREGHGGPERPALFEEDEAPFEGIPPSEAQQKAGEKWEAKASGKQDSRDPRDAEANAPAPEAGPQTPDEKAEVKTWAEAERKRIVALKDVADVAAAGEALVADARFKRLIAYDQADARRIDRSIKKHIEDLGAG